MNKILIALLITLSIVLPSMAQNPNPDNLRVDSILASVNGTPLSLLDIVDETNAEETRLRMLYSGKELKAKVKALRLKALNDAIDRQLIVDDYNNDPFDIPRQHIENMIDKMSWNFSDGTRKSLKRKVEEAGISLDDFEGKARDRIIIEYMLGTLFFKSNALTPKEVYEYYQKNKDKYTIPASIRLQVLFLQGKTEDNKELIKEISNDLKSGNGKIFKSLVMLHSVAPNAKSGGDLGWIDTDKLRPEFAVALKDRKTGYVSEAVTTPEGIYFIRIAEQRAGGIKAFKEVNKQIHDELRNRSRDEAYKEYIKKLRSKAIIHVYIKG